jgi:NADH:ubiquinone oxidoreductase subunit 4 (subunit M)
MKSLVAYSSVVHIGIIIRGLTTLFLIGFEGGFCMILGHGIVSSGLFFLVGVMYDRLGRRRVIINKGLIVILPFLSILWFILCIYNISAPPSISLLREIFLTARLLQWDTILFIWLILINFMGIVFTFYLYSQTQQGKPFRGMIRIFNVNVRELLIGVLHARSVFFLVFVF